MYSEDDINSAVTAGALSPEAAQSFRNHMSRMRDLPRGSEENFRLLNSFNDIFVSIGVVILLLAVGAIGQAIGEGLAGGNDQLHDTFQVLFAGGFVAGASWPLAEFFTRKRRMGLPSILLLLAFVGGTFAAVFGLSASFAELGNERLAAILGAGSALVAAGAAYVHWKRFMVPITVAAGAAALSGTAIGLIASIVGPDAMNEQVLLGLVFLAGLAVFTFAMRWDITDRDRTTRRSDVAFWLHLLAAPMIAHPIFALIGVTEGDNIGLGAAFGVLAVYVGFGLVALAIDRRALLVSALAYVLAALTFLFDEFGAVELNFALTALVIGSALLTLSAFWLPIRKAVVAALPEDLQAKVPTTEDVPLAVANTSTA